MPICLGQMSERYLLWASALSATLICISAGWGLFHVLLTLLAAGMTLRNCGIRSRPLAALLRLVHRHLSRWFAFDGGAGGNPLDGR